MKERNEGAFEAHAKMKEAKGEDDVQELHAYIFENFAAGIDKQRRQEALRELDVKLRAYAVCIQKEQRSGAENIQELLKQLEGLVPRIEEDDFAGEVYALLLPIAQVLHKDPVLRESVDREAIMMTHHYIPLGKLLTYERQGTEARLHFLPAKTVGRAAILQDIQTGLSRLAQMAKDDPTMTRVIGTSWIAARAPRLLERLGFTLGDVIDAEIREVSMNREVLLEKYLKQSHVEE